MIAYFARHPTAANLLMLAFMAAGLVAMPSLLRETLPRIPADKVEVRVLYPGASTAKVEEAVCRRLEDAGDGVDDLKEIRCVAEESSARATLVMREGADIDRFETQIRSEVEAISDFPAETEDAVVTQLGLTDFVVSIALTGPMTPGDLKVYAEEVRDRLLREPELSKVEVRGFSGRQFRVEVAKETLQHLGLSVQRLAEIIGKQSLDRPAGTLEATDREILILFTDERRARHAFEGIVVRGGEGGAIVRLGDIATITDRFEVAEERILFNGERAALLDVIKRRDEDTLRVVDAVRRFVMRERETPPPGVEIALTNDIASVVHDRLRLLSSNGLQGLILVLVVMAGFFGLRYSFWVAMGLPTSFLGALAVMLLFGLTINMITMVALLLAIGLLMDDAIVIAENIAAHVERGADGMTAAIEGTREVLPGVFSSFATTVIVFLPLAFITGEIGAVLRALPIVLIAVMAVSLVEAFLILPAHLGHALAKRAEVTPGGVRGRIEGAITRTRERVLGRAVDFAVDQRYLLLGLVVGLFLATLAMTAAGIVKFRAFPDIDGDVVEARVLLPQGTPLARTEAVVARLVAAVGRIDEEFSPRQPEGDALVRNIMVRYNHNLDSNEHGPHVATVLVDLLAAETRVGRVQEIQNRWSELVGTPPDVLAITYKQPAVGPGGRAIEIRLVGEDLAGLEGAAGELSQWLAGYRGVLNVDDDLRPGKPELRLKLRDEANGLGLDAETIAGQLRAAYFGRTAAEIQVGAEAYEVDVRLAARDRDGRADFDAFTVTTSSGAQVPIGAVAEIEPGRGFGRILRVDGRRTVTVTGDIDGAAANANEVIADTARRFFPEFRARHPGIEISLKGQQEEQATTQGSMARAMGISLIGLFVILSFVFRSYVEPLIVMAAIPLAFIGVVWGHLALGLEISLPSNMGFISLAGIVVNDSILLVLFIKRHHAAGEAVHDAARSASRARFRAVLLTSLTTIGGLLPLLAETSLQAQVLIPLAASLAFGLMASTLLVLLVVPAFYTVLEDLGYAKARAHGEMADGRRAEEAVS